MMQAMTGLVEEGSDIVMGEGCRTQLAILVANWSGKIAVEVSDGLLDVVTGQCWRHLWPLAAADCLVHPGATTFGQAPPRLVSRA